MGAGQYHGGATQNARTPAYAGGGYRMSPPQGPLAEGQGRQTRSWSQPGIPGGNAGTERQMAPQFTGMNAGQGLGPRGLMPGQPAMPQSISQEAINPVRETFQQMPRPNQAPPYTPYTPDQPDYMNLSQVPRRTTGNQNTRTDFMLGGAQDQLRRGYEAATGRTPGDYEIESQLRGQGWQGGDRFVGQGGLQAILKSLAESEEGKAYKESGKNAIQRQNEAEGKTQPEETESKNPEKEKRVRGGRGGRKGIGPSYE